jgi:hypothetical protein
VNGMLTGIQALEPEELAPLETRRGYGPYLTLNQANPPPTMEKA